MLRLSALTKTYAGGVHALRDITLDVPTGMFGLLGPNGAGKSTLMRTIATLQQPDSGSIQFDSIDVLRDPRALRQQLGYLPQEFGAYPRTSADAMLRHFAALKGLRGREHAQAVDSLLRRVGLDDARHRSVATFSGGMKQRFGIAQALLGSPRLLIVDEPTAGLDPAERRRFQNLLAEVGEQVCVILSTHIVDDVAELCARVAVMGDGRILACGAPADLVGTLRGRVWTTMVSYDEAASLRARCTVLSSRLKGGRREMRILADAGGGVSISGNANVPLVPAEPDLEDVYFSTLLAHGVAAPAE